MDTLKLNSDWIICIYTTHMTYQGTMHLIIGSSLVYLLIHPLKDAIVVIYFVLVVQQNTYQGAV